MRWGEEYRLMRGEWTTVVSQCLPCETPVTGSHPAVLLSSAEITASNCWWLNLATVPITRARVCNAFLLLSTFVAIWNLLRVVTHRFIILSHTNTTIKTDCDRNPPDNKKFTIRLKSKKLWSSIVPHSYDIYRTHSPQFPSRVSLVQPCSGRERCGGTANNHFIVFETLGKLSNNSKISSFYIASASLIHMGTRCTSLSVHSQPYPTYRTPIP